MKTRFIPVALVALLLLSCLAVLACGSEDTAGETSTSLSGIASKFGGMPIDASPQVDSELVGVWLGDDGISIEFRSDGTCTESDGDASLSYTYTIEGDVVTLESADGEGYDYGLSARFTVSGSGDSLTLIDLDTGVGFVYERVTASAGSDPALVGVWVDEDGETLAFFSDGSGEEALDDYSAPWEFTYRVEGSTVIFVDAQGAGEAVFTYSVSGGTLTLTDLDSGHELVYARTDSEGSVTQQSEATTSWDIELTGVWFGVGGLAGSWLAVYPDESMVWAADLETWEEYSGDYYRFTIQGDSMIVTDWEGGGSESWVYSVREGDAVSGDVPELSLPDSGSPSGDVYTFERMPLDVLLVGPWLESETGDEAAYFGIDGTALVYTVDSEQEELEVEYYVEDGYVVLEIQGMELGTYPYNLIGTATEDLFDDVLELTDSDTGDVTVYDRYAP